MSAKLLLFLFIYFLFVSLSNATLLKKEKLPNGDQIAFFTIDDKPFSKKQLQIIEKDIDSRIKKMSNLFVKQSPKKNLHTLYQFKQHLDNISANNKKYKISNTPLSAQILLLSYFLDSLPKLKSFNPKNCQDYIHSLTIKAHVSVHGNELNQWIDQVLQLSHNLCQKNILLKAKLNPNHEPI